jgi:CelD/BcsL family acetyltransferase involved in cellulose biosynthesis
VMSGLENPGESATSKAGVRNKLPLRVVVAETPIELRSHEIAWQQLADQSLEPNVFYEPWMMRPALEFLGRGERVRFVFIYRGILLQGFFPILIKPRYRNIPVRVLTFWKHVHCFLCTPLIRPAGAADCLAELFHWARVEQQIAAIEMEHVHGDGRFSQLLTDHMLQGRLLAFEDSKHTRALLVRGTDGESYVADALSTGSLKELRRQRRRLAESGNLELRTLERQCDVEDWLEQFLLLEASGWKERTAIAANASERSFFMEAARTAFDRGRLMMLGLAMDGRFIAMKCNLRSAGGTFAFKIAFDPHYNRFSPGVLLELDNIIAAHSRSDVPWMDSCAMPNHSMINRLWKERRTIQTLLISTGNWRGDVLVSTLPMLRLLARALRGTKNA